jgi:hypothetical protein
MLNRDVHLRVGAVSGVAYAAYHAWGQHGPYVLAEGAVGLVGGIGGGLLPDWIDAPCSPRHRAEAHSMSVTGTVGYFINQQLPQWQANLRAEAETTRSCEPLRPCCFRKSVTAFSNCFAPSSPVHSQDFSLVMPRTWL